MKARSVLGAVTLSVAIMAACGSGDGRPSDEAWGSVWQRQRDSVPEAGVFLDKGEDLCGELVGELRSGRKELLPTPTEGLDDPVHAWLSHAESIAFDCPTHDPNRLRTRLHDLDILAAEIDAGLAADADTPDPVSSIEPTAETP